MNNTNISIIDGSYFTFRAIYSSINNDILSSDYICFLVVRMLIKEISLYPSFPIIAFDYGGSTYRKSLLPEYKGDRVTEYSVSVKIPSGEYEGLEINDKQVPANELITIIGIVDPDTEEYSYIRDTLIYKLYTETREWCIEKLPTIGMLVIKYFGYEADDIASLFSEYSNHSGLLISDDNDWKLYLNKRFSLRRSMADETISINDFNKQMEWEHDDIPSTELFKHILALTGTHNNVSGYYGIGGSYGWKIAKKILLNTDINNKYSSLSESSKREATVLQDTSLYERNLKIIGSEHIKQDKDKLALMILETYMTSIKSPNRLNYICMSTSIGSETLDSMYPTFRNSIRIPTPEYLYNNIVQC